MPLRTRRAPRFLGSRARPTVRVSRALLVVGLVAACVAAFVIAAPALATNEYFECSSCSAENGIENYVTNTQAINHSGGGICAQVWKNNGGGSYTSEAFECAEGGGTATACSYKEFVGHGEAKTESTPGYLRGRQDNYKSCG